jgi:glycosyltransferase involved in cell wall biosynthesis
MRLAVYSDFSYRREGDALFAELPFVLFLIGLLPHFERVALVGRLDPTPGRLPYSVPPSVLFAPLPHYTRLSDPAGAVTAAVGSVRRFWSVLDEADVVWLLGPHPLALAFAVLARLRRRRIVLGVRQDFPLYARYRHPSRHSLHVAASLLQAAFQWVGRRTAVIVVGSELARHYRRAGRLLSVWISLVAEGDIAPAATFDERRYDGELTMLSVGRLEAEKNPLLLADILALAREADPRWRLVVCGEGPMLEDLERRLRELGVAHAAELRGYVPVDGPLIELYRSSHVFLHVSFTEGVPQVLIEAFAARLPVVGTAVGGVPEMAGEAALLVPPGDGPAAARALERVAADAGLREALVGAGLEQVRAHTLEAECARVARFLMGDDPPPSPAAPSDGARPARSERGAA